VDLRGRAGHVEGQSQQNAELVAGIHRVDVIAGVGLRVTGLLRLGERGVERFSEASG